MQISLQRLVVIVTNTNHTILPQTYTYLVTSEGEDLSTELPIVISLALVCFVLIQI